MNISQEMWESLRMLSRGTVLSFFLNLSKISWDSLENTRGTKEVAFLEILNDHFLTQLNFISTCRDRVLDIVITNVADRVRVREVLSQKDSDRRVHGPWHGVF